MSKGFFQEDESTKEASIYRIMAEGLSYRLRTMGRISKAPNLNRWANEFRKICGAGSVLLKELKEVFIWYKHNMENPFLPQVYSARSFHEKYNRIRAAYLKENPQKELSSLHPKTMEVFTVLSTLKWPVSKEAHVLTTISTTLTRYSSFLETLRSVSG